MPDVILMDISMPHMNGLEAIGHLRLSIASNPAYPQARLDLGLLLINEGRFDEAIRELSAAAATARTNS